MRKWPFIAVALLCVLLLPLPARADAAKDLTKKAVFEQSEGSIKRALDGNLTTYWTNKNADARILVAVPDGEIASALYIKWVKPPSGFSIAQFDDEQDEFADADGYSGYVGFYSLSAEARMLELRFASKGAAIAELRLIGQGDIPGSIQQWNAPCEKADLMVVSAHQDDEFLYFGGTIPYYCALGKRVQVVYVANCGRSRYQEALDGLWAVGLRNAPDFMGLPDKFSKSLKDAQKHWDVDKFQQQLVLRIRKYRPDVIVSHDLNGEYGHGAHRLTAKALSDVMEMAADPTEYPESAEKYGPWQVKKLYLHLYGKNKITMPWKTKQEALGGKTPSQLAKQGYAKHKSQLKDFDYDVESKKYDNRKFGLAFTTVGSDARKDDMFEHVPEMVVTPAPTLAPTPTPTASPVPAVTPAAPTPAPVEPKPVSERPQTHALLWVAMGAAALSAGAGGALWFRQRTRTHRRKARRRLTATK